MWDDTATSSPVPFPEKLSAEARKLGGQEAREELGVCSQGKGLTCSVFPGEGKGRGGEGREEGGVRKRKAAKDQVFPLSPQVPGGQTQSPTASVAVDGQPTSNWVLGWMPQRSMHRKKDVQKAQGERCQNWMVGKAGPLGGVSV